MQNQSVAPPLDVEGESQSSFPVLVMHNWCPFTSPATSLWQKAAESAGRTLQIAYADTLEGAAVIKSLDIRGVPCVATAPGNLHYGMSSPEEAAEFMKD